MGASDRPPGLGVLRLLSPAGSRRKEIALVRMERS